MYNIIIYTYICSIHVFLRTRAHTHTCNMCFTSNDVAVFHMFIFVAFGRTQLQASCQWLQADSECHNSCGSEPPLAETELSC